MAKQELNKMAKQEEKENVKKEPKKPTLAERVEAEKKYLGDKAYVLFVQPNKHPMGEEVDSIFPMMIDSAGSTAEMVKKYVLKGAKIVGFNYAKFKDDERTLSIKQMVELLSKNVDRKIVVEDDDSYLAKRLAEETKKQAAASE